jgi:hypothetical protein
MTDDKMDWLPFLTAATAHLQRIADASERIADALETNNDETSEPSLADHVALIGSCVSTDEGDGLCETLVRAAKIVRKTE